MSKQKDNFLDYIPMIDESVNFVEKDNIITLFVPHKGILNWIAQKLFFMPDHTKLSFDYYGSYIWRQINGCRTVYDIGSHLKDEYGEAVEPLYERLIEFLMLLKQQKFITFIKP